MEGHIVNDIYYRPWSSSTTSSPCKTQKLRTLYFCPCCAANYQSIWKTMSGFRGVENHVLTLNEGINKKKMTPFSEK